MRRMDSSEIIPDAGPGQRPVDTDGNHSGAGERAARIARLATSTGSIDIEYAWIDGAATDRPLIVFLHEGLGSLGIWGDWPRRLCDAAGCRGLIFSRYGYGYSSPRPAGPWPGDYMDREAAELLPALLGALGIDAERDRPIVFGHSDGGTIALQYAARHPQALRAVVAVAAHIHVEEVTVARICAMRKDFGNGKLAGWLARLHRDGRAVFEGWSGIWTAPAALEWNIAPELGAIACPALIVQGRQDQYATLEQVTGIQARVPQAEAAVIEDCRHVPHEEKPDEVLRLVADFLARHGATR